MHIISRILVFGAGWFACGLVIGGFIWDKKTKGDARASVRVGLIGSALLWAVILGLIYW